MRLATTVLSAACVSLALLAPPANATDSRGIEIPAFYDPPASIPAAPGQLIRSEEMPLAVSLPGIFPGTATRLMYATTDSDGDPAPATGALIESTKSWEGPGARPVVAFAVGTIGQGDHCAPSYGLEHPLVVGIGEENGTLGVNYDMLQMSALLNKGYNVALTDYIGLGSTDRVHTYMNRVDQAHALLDVVRAAKQVPGTSVTEQSKVGVWGYSQGGGAAAAAAELAASYAPDVNLVGTYAGAPPADLESVISGVDGNLIAGVLGYTLNGLAQTYPQLQPIIDANINADGAAALEDLATRCIVDTIGKYAFSKSSDWTKSGESLSQIVADNPAIQSVVQAQRIGKIKPSAPVLVATQVNDGTVPHRQVRQLALDWCGKGAQVTYNPIGLPPLFGDTDRFALNHIAGTMTSLPSALDWMEDRFEGRSHRSNCRWVRWML